MFYRIITGDKALTAFIILLLAIVTWIPSFFSPVTLTGYQSDSSMPLYLLLLKVFQDHYYASKIFAFLLVNLLGLLLVRLNAKFILIQQRTFLQSLFLILLSGFIPENLNISGAFIASLFMVFALNALMHSYKTDPNSYSFFTAGLMLGLGSLFYAPMIYFIAFVWISATFLRSFYWREYIFPILGLLVPYAFYFVWMFIFDINIPDFLDQFRESLFGGFPPLNIGLPYKIFGGYVLLLIFIASVYMLKVFQFRKIYLRNFFLILFWLFLTSIAVFVLLSGFNTGLIYVISIPVTYLLTNYFCNSRKSWGNKTLLYLLILGVVFLAVNRQVGWFISF